MSRSDTQNLQCLRNKFKRDIIKLINMTVVALNLLISASSARHGKGM